MDPCEQHLIALRDELARRGVRCELDDRGIWPRLRIYCPGETAGADFDNNVVSTPVSGQRCYCWPSATPIGPVTYLMQAAETIIDELGIHDWEDEDGRTNVASLAVSRMLRQARLEISRPLRVLKQDMARRHPRSCRPSRPECTPVLRHPQAIDVRGCPGDMRRRAVAGVTIARDGTPFDRSARRAPPRTGHGRPG